MIQWENFSKAKIGVIASLTFIFIVTLFLLLLLSICASKFPLQYLQGMMTDTTGKLKIDILTIRMWKKIEANCRKTATSSIFFVLDAELDLQIKCLQKLTGGWHFCFVAALQVVTFIVTAVLFTLYKDKNNPFPLFAQNGAVPKRRFSVSDACICDSWRWRGCPGTRGSSLLLFKPSEKALLKRIPSCKTSDRWSSLFPVW